MPITVATTYEQELAALKAQAMHHVALGARRVEGETWRILDLEVSVHITVRPHGRSGQSTPHTTWLLGGRRTGWNALLGALRRQQAALEAER